LAVFGRPSATLDSKKYNLFMSEKKEDENPIE
jgi:hypothetical protein